MIQIREDHMRFISELARYSNSEVGMEFHRDWSETLEEIGHPQGVRLSLKRGSVYKMHTITSDVSPLKYIHPLVVLADNLLYMQTFLCEWIFEFPAVM